MDNKSDNHDIKISLKDQNMNRRLGNDAAANVDITITDYGTLDSGGNDPQRQEWFSDLALGLFIHWSLDTPLGCVMNHGMIGASDHVLDKYINELPKMFYPRYFDPEDYALLARQCGFKYMVLTSKHHSGFCMWDTKTTDYNVINSRYGKDIVGMMADAFRKQELAFGLYFSPIDFNWTLKNKPKLTFLDEHSDPDQNSQLVDYNIEQIKELLYNYGEIDMMFFDGPCGKGRLKETVWQLQPQALVTRGEMPTPEQQLRDGVKIPWEASYTIGDSWNYKATHRNNKTATEIIKLLIEIRAKGGNLLLNINPDPWGRIMPDQEEVLRELGLWLFYNDQAICNTRPWRVTHESLRHQGTVWYTKGKDSDTVYAFLAERDWKYGNRETVWLEGVKVTQDSQVQILGQKDVHVEHLYVPEEQTATRWKQHSNGLEISAVRCYRPYNTRDWHNPVVVRITNAK